MECDLYRETEGGEEEKTLQKRKTDRGEQVTNRKKREKVSYIAHELST